MFMTLHFKRSEFECKCGCGYDTIDAELIAILEALRTHFGKPVTISSGCRCPEYNERIGGAKSSQHMRGRAADIRVYDTNPEAVAAYLKEAYPARYGIGEYSTFTHIDTRGGKARWKG